MVISNGAGLWYSSSDSNSGNSDKKNNHDKNNDENDEMRTSNDIINKNTSNGQ